MRKKQKVATEESLGLLHKLLGDVFLHQVNQEIDGINKEQSGELDADGELYEHFSTLTPAMITSMLKYLDSSDITCSREKGDVNDELNKRMQEMKDKRKASNILDISKAVNED